MESRATVQRDKFVLNGNGMISRAPRAGTSTLMRRGTIDSYKSPENSSTITVEVTPSTLWSGPSSRIGSSSSHEIGTGLVGGEGLVRLEWRSGSKGRGRPWVGRSKE